MVINRKKTIGQLMSIGLFIPLFGHTFSIFGIHNRILSFIILLIAAVFSIKYFRFNKINKHQFLFFFLVLLLLFFEFLQSESSQKYRLITLNFDKNNYFENKLALTFLILTIPLITSFIITAISSSKEFLDGFISGFLPLSALVIVVSLNSSEYWFTNDFSQRTDFNELNLFSQISISILHMLGVLLSIFYYFRKKYYLAFSLLIVSIIFLIVYQQRSSWIYVVLSLSMLVFLQGSTLNKIKYLIIISFISILTLIIGIRTGVFTNSVLSYADQIVTGNLLSTRNHLYDFAWSGFLDNPLGNGYGSFSKYGFHNYPHNIILESLYELGLFPTTILATILLYSLTLAIKCINSMRRNNNYPRLIIGLIIGYLLIVVLKSGDLTSIETLLSVSLLFLGFNKQIKQHT